MAVLRLVPLLGVMLVIYVALVMGGDGAVTLGNEVMGMDLISEARWTFTLGELLLAIGVFALYLEILKATRTGAASVVDHSLSMLVFVVYLVLFLTVTDCGTSTFVILGLMALVDVVAGFTITIATSRRDLAVNGAL